MTIETQQKSFLLTALAIAPTIWTLSFNYGVYKTVFYEHLFVIWAISVTALICGIVVKLDEKLVSFSTWKGRILLILPSIWVVSGYWAHQSQAGSLIYWLDVVLTIATVLLSLPYILYYVVIILVPGAKSIYSKKLMISLILITTMIGAIGFLIGYNHSKILFCENFKIAGNHLPENCWRQSNIK